MHTLIHRRWSYCHWLQGNLPRDDWRVCKTLKKEAWQYLRKKVCSMSVWTWSMYVWCTWKRKRTIGSSNDSYAHALIHTSHVHLVGSIDSSPHIHNRFLALKMKIASKMHYRMHYFDDVRVCILECPHPFDGEVRVTMISDVSSWTGTSSSWVSSAARNSSYWGRWIIS